MSHSGDSNSDIGGLTSKFFRRQQAPGFLEPLDVIFQRITTRLGGLCVPAHLRIIVSIPPCTACLERQLYQDSVFNYRHPTSAEHLRTM